MLKDEKLLRMTQKRVINSSAAGMQLKTTTKPTIMLADHTCGKTVTAKHNIYAFTVVDGNGCTLMQQFHKLGRPRALTLNAVCQLSLLLMFKLKCQLSGFPSASGCVLQTGYARMGLCVKQCNGCCVECTQVLCELVQVAVRHPVSNSCAAHQRNVPLLTG